MKFLFPDTPMQRNKPVPDFRGFRGYTPIILLIWLANEPIHKYEGGVPTKPTKPNLTDSLSKCEGLLCKWLFFSRRCQMSVRLTIYVRLKHLQLVLPSLCLIDLPSLYEVSFFG